MKREIPCLMLLILILVACTPTSITTPTATVAPTSTSTPSPDPTPTATPTPLAPREGWWNDAVFYEVFVRSFYDSDEDGKGDLPGLIARLDYLNDGDPETEDDLGVTALWLMPIQQSPSYHGYDVIDYYTVEEDYGTNEDFQELIDEAHRRGIRVIIDLVMNHTSSAHPWFINSSTGDDAEKRDWYVWSDTGYGYQGPWGQRLWYQRGDAWYYAIFWSEMPDLNYHTPEVTAQMYDIAAYWLEEMDVDGFRLDAARYLIEEDLDSSTPRLATTEINLDWLEAFRTHYASIEPEAMTVGEVWSNTAEVDRYLEEGSLDLAFEFDLAEAILSSAAVGSPSSLRSAMRQITGAYEDYHIATFLTNHDQDRVMERLRGDIDRAKLAAATYLTLPGVPFIYYGEEIGMLGHKPDEQIRTPMQWSAEEGAGFTTGLPWEPINETYTEVNVAAQNDDPRSLLSHYRRLIHLRNAHPALRTGALIPVESADAMVYAYLRVKGEDRILVVLNYAGLERPEVTLTLEESPLGAGTYDLTALLGDRTLPPLVIGENGGTVEDLALGTLAPRQTLVVEVTAR